MLKTFGYLVSTLSVLLLGYASWEGASKHVATLLALTAGMAASIAGMAMRWLTYVMEHRRQLRESGVKGPLFP